MEPNHCPGLFYGTPAQDGFLMRIRTPGGFLNFQQGQAIAILMEEWNSAAIQVTNRANLQIRAVHSSPSTEVFSTLQTLGLAARNPKIDHLRNVMASPTAGIDSQELINTRPLVQSLDAYIQTHPELADLPAKFSIGIDGGGAVGIGTRYPCGDASRTAIPWEHRYNEIQLSAVAGSGKWGNGNQDVYFRLDLGEDKGLCDTEVLIEPDQCLSVITALTRAYLDYVQQNHVPQNYVHQHSHQPKKPRMKHLLQDWGLERYLQQANQYLTYPLRRVAACPEPCTTQRYAHLGVHPQRQPGLSYIGVHLGLGQLTGAQLRGLMQLSATFGSGELRLTPWQTVLLPDIPNQQVTEVLQHLELSGLSVSDNWVAAAIVACGGKPGCAASATQTQTDAIALTQVLNQHLRLESPVNIHFTGCRKSCAQPSPAEITLLGTTIEQSGEVVEGYQVYVSTSVSAERCSGGDAPEDASGDAPGDALGSVIQHHLGTVLAPELPAKLEKLLSRYQQNRVRPDEYFGDFAARCLISKTQPSVMFSSF